MTTRYEVVKAKTARDAIDKAKFKAGDLVRVNHVEAVANGDGTFSVFPIIEPIETESNAASE